MAEESNLADGGLFALNKNVRVFETNIRVLGGLLSAHQLAESFLSKKVLRSDVWNEDKSILNGRVPKDVCAKSGGQTESGLPTACVGDACILEGDSGGVKESQECKNNTARFWSYDGFLLELAQDIG